MKLSEVGGDTTEATPPVATPQSGRRLSQISDAAPRRTVGAFMRQEKEARPQPTSDDYIGRSLENLGEGIREIPRQAGALVGNFFKSLLPTEEGARAGGDVVRKLGDIGTFASGGLAGPLGIPGGPVGQATARFGAGVPDPAVAPVPRPQLALPPPQVGVPRGPATPTGPGYPPQPQGPIRFTPTPPSGAIPGAPPATATTPSPPPSATVPGGGGVIQPPPGVGGRPLRAAGAAPGMPGRAPQAPEPPPVPGAPPRPSPLDLMGAKQGQPSDFATALVKMDPEVIDRKLVRDYRGLVNTRRPDQLSAKQLKLQDQRITTAFDSIIDAKNDISFSDANGVPQRPGQTPRSLENLSEGIDALEHSIYENYTAAAQRAGQQGVRVPLGPTADHIEQLVNAPHMRLFDRGIRNKLLETAAELRAEGAMNPLQMQNTIQHLNARTKGVQTAESISENAVMAQALHTMRQTLNTTMEQALQGPQYAALRAQYGALRSIRDDVANALRKEWGNKPGLIDRASDHVFWLNAAHGLVTLNPAAIGNAVALKSAQALTKYLRSNNRAVTRMFNARVQTRTPTPTDIFSSRLGTTLGEVGQRAYDRSVLPPQPYVGTSGM